MKFQFLTAVAVVGLLASPPTLAQKAKDTLRMPLSEPIAGLTIYLNSNVEMEYSVNAVQDTLIVFDEQENKFAPLLAKSWKRIDDRTVEFELRDDVSWHDGQKFDAEDVKSTLEWATDPEVKLRNKQYFDWIEKVDILGPYKLRVVTRAPTPWYESQLAVKFHIQPEHLYAKLPLNDKMSFTRKPIGTGMYRATEVNDAKGIYLAKNDAYKHGGTAKPASAIKNQNLLFMPDAGSRIAEFLAGNLDILRQISTDQMMDVSRQPHVKTALVQGPTIAYMQLDARGRAGVKALTDSRVRRAMFMAVDRGQLAKLAVGDFTLNATPEGMCWKDQMACDFSVQPPAFDPAAAKKLLAEAGYPDGFDVEIATFTSSVSDYAVAIAGQLAKIGIRTSVQKYALATHRKIEGDGKIAVFVGSYPAGSLPDAANVLATFFDPDVQSNYHGDPELGAMLKKLDGMMDQDQRRAMARQMFDRATEQAYFMAVGPRPVPMVYRDDVDVKLSRYASVGFQPGGVTWK